jgi:hypothetical protein
VTTEELLDAIVKVTTPLRMGDGIDAAALETLTATLGRLAGEWSGRAEVPKDAAAALAELYPAVTGASYAYPTDYGDQVRDLAETLFDLVSTCFGD